MDMEVERDCIKAELSFCAEFGWRNNGCPSHRSVGVLLFVMAIWQVGNKTEPFPEQRWTHFYDPAMLL